MLLQSDATPDLSDQEGTTPLMIAIKNPLYNEEIVSLLIQHGADLDIKDHKDMSALSHAIVFGYIEKAAILLDAGASISSNIKKIPIHSATIWKVLNLLNEKGRSGLTKDILLQIIETHHQHALNSANRHASPLIIQWTQSAFYFFDLIAHKQPERLLHDFFINPHADDEDSLRLPFDRFLGVCLDENGTDLFMEVLSTSALENPIKHRIASKCTHTIIMNGSKISYHKISTALTLLHQHHPNHWLIESVCKEIGEIHLKYKALLTILNGLSSYSFALSLFLKSS